MPSLNGDVRIQAHDDIHVDFIQNTAGYTPNNSNNDLKNISVPSINLKYLGSKPMIRDAINSAPTSPTIKRKYSANN